ncbi:hypothetical protein RCL1_006914 [Eukaryota sp. TZLM3-RCL]
MTSLFDDIKWRRAVVDTSDLLKEDDITPTAAPLANSPDSLILIQKHFLKYHELFQRLSSLYDTLLQPQKRSSVFNLLQALAGRYAELRSIIIKLSLSGTPIFDDVLHELSLVPHALSFTIPKFIKGDRKDIVDANNKLTSDLIKKFQLSQSLVVPPALDDGLPKPSSSSMSLEDAIKLIQRAERCRQGKQRARFIHSAWLMEYGKDTSKAVDEAAKLIQTTYRDYIKRKRQKEDLIKDKILFKLIPNINEVIPTNRINELAQKEELIRSKYKETQRQFEKAYHEGVEREKKVLRSGGEQAFLEDLLHDQFREWVATTEESTGTLPEDISGFKSLINPVVVSEEVEEEGEESGTSEKKKEKKGEKAGKKEEKKGSKGKKGGKKSKTESKKENPPSTASQFGYDLVSSVQNYFSTWESKMIESQNLSKQISLTENPVRPFDRDLILDAERPVWEKEVRESMMGVLEKELEDLKAAVKLRNASAVKKGKGKKGKKGKKKSKGKKKGSKGKDKKSKKTEKDSGNPLEDYARLVRFGHVKPSDPLSLSSFTYSYHRLSSVLAKVSSPLDPCLGTSISFLSQQISLVLGFESVRKSKIVPQTCLLFGPAGNGKKTLVKTFASELGAILIELSPSLFSQHPANKMAELCKTCLAVAKAMGPTIIMISEVERLFVNSKKKKKGAKKDPLSEHFTKFKKELVGKSGSADYSNLPLFVFGLSNSPFDGDFKSLNLYFNSSYFISIPDYENRRKLFTDSIAKLTGKHHLNFISDESVSSLAHVLEGFSCHAILSSIKSILTPSRIRKLSSTMPLEVAEFVDAIVDYEPLSSEEYQSHRQFLQKLPYYSFFAPPKVEEEEPKEDKKKGEKKKKK